MPAQFTVESASLQKYLLELAQSSVEQNFVHSAVEGTDKQILLIIIYVARFLEPADQAFSYELL
jgi:hypothetical protein